MGMGIVAPDKKAPGEKPEGCHDTHFAGHRAEVQMFRLSY